MRRLRVEVGERVLGLGVWLTGAGAAMTGMPPMRVDARRRHLRRLRLACRRMQRELDRGGAT